MLKVKEEGGEHCEKRALSEKCEKNFKDELCKCSCLEYSDIERGFSEQKPFLLYSLPLLVPRRTIHAEGLKQQEETHIDQESVRRPLVTCPLIAAAERKENFLWNSIVKIDVGNRGPLGFLFPALSVPNPYIDHSALLYTTERT
ncbi:hypothetical protein HZH68_009035 [Vespula germanica]|uniref:Uncharacterized protein n=1 Tax=Vespula germanica TaxID=30212 RepID=A0A834K0D0_VESGE|nr:hypothetical protein HZH68_009035 [Vespula germanica]